jgi:hypothetical protein
MNGLRVVFFGPDGFYDRKNPGFGLTLQKKIFIISSMG